MTAYDASGQGVVTRKTPVDPIELIRTALAEICETIEDCDDDQVVVELPPSEVLPKGHRLLITMERVDLDVSIRELQERYGTEIPEDLRPELEALRASRGDM